MSYNCKVSREAEDDIFEAYFWYENQSAGLGEKFLAFFETSLKSITKKPSLYRIRYKGLRACPVKQFPYLICYSVKNSEVLIIAVFHTSHNPVVWKNRLL